MAFYLSPSVYVKEKDLTTSIPAVATNIAGFVGKFTWGKAFEKVFITMEEELVSEFGKPTLNNNEDFLIASSYLAYSNKLWTVRVLDEASSYNARMKIANNGDLEKGSNGIYIPNEEYYQTHTFSPNDEGMITYPIVFVAKYPGEYGNKIKVAYSDKLGFYNTVIRLSDITGTFQVGETVTGLESGATATVVAVSNNGIAVKDVSGTFTAGEEIDGDTSGASGDFVSLVTDYAEITSGVYFKDVFEYIPEAKQYALVVMVDGEIVEKYYVAFEEGITDYEGNNIFIEDVLAEKSKYIYVFTKFNSIDDFYNNGSLQAIGDIYLTEGAEGEPTEADFIKGYDLFANAEEMDINLIIEPAGATTILQQYIIDNIVEGRKDCFAILNVPKSEILGQDTSTATSNILTYVNDTLMRSSSYAGIYPNYKLEYDKYNKKKVWVSIVGDVAGIFAYTDTVADPWFAPAGYNRGVLKNVNKLAFNPEMGNRDLLYKENINPVIMGSEGAIVYGQKTLLKKPSAFDRVNVRRLFITMEKGISTALKYFLFENNTEFTRKQVVNMLEPYLRDIQGRGGIYDFKVVCNETNNTPERIDRNELWVDVYVKPTRTAEFIVLNMVAVKTGVKFEEIVGKA